MNNNPTALILVLKSTDARTIVGGKVGQKYNAMVPSSSISQSAIIRVS